MDSFLDRVVQSFRRVIDWFAANPQVLAEGPASSPGLAKLVDDLKGCVARAAQHVTNQQTQEGQALLMAKDERERRTDLLTHHMTTIAQVASALKGKVQGIGVVAIPKGHLPTPALVSAALALAAPAKTYAQVLIDKGLPRDFLEQLETAALALQASFDARGQARAARTGAVRSLEQEVALGRNVVATMDAVLRRSLRSDPAKFAEWKQLKRVVKKPAALRVPAGLLQPAESAPASGAVQPALSTVQPSPTSNPKA